MKKYLLPFILVCSFLLRLYKGTELFFWNVDEEIVGLTVKRILIDHHPQLIGFPIPGGIYLGPLYYYLISPIYFLSGLDPLKFYFFSALLATITTFLVYKVGSIVFEKKLIGIIASIIYAFGYFSNVYGRLLSGLSIGPILSLLTYLILYRNIKTKKPTHLFFLGLVLLIASQNEGSSFSLIVLAVASWLIFKFKVPISKFLQVLGAFVLFNIPTFVFDLRHNFYISKSLLAFFSGPKQIHSNLISINSIVNVLNIFPLTLARILYPTGIYSTSSQILPCSELISKRITTIPFFVFVLSSLIIGFFLLSICLKKKKTIGENIITLHLLIAIVGIIGFNVFLNGYLYEWILVIFLPAFCLMAAYFLNFLFEKNVLTKVLALLVLVWFLLFNIKAVLSSSDNFGLLAKVAAVKVALTQVEGEDFYFDSIGSCYQNGYMYLFWKSGHFPSASSMDDMYSGTFYKKSATRPKKTVVISSPLEKESTGYKNKYNFYKEHSSFDQKVGSIEVMVVEDN